MFKLRPITFEQEESSVINQQQVLRNLLEQYADRFNDSYPYYETRGLLMEQHIENIREALETGKPFELEINASIIISRDMVNYQSNYIA